MVMGRPREWDRKSIMIQMLEWAQLPNALNLNAFCVMCDPMIPPSKLIQISKDDEDFRQAYELTKAFIAARREEMHSDKILSDAAYNRNARVYDRFQDYSWRDEESFKSNLKKDEEGVKQTTFNLVASNELTSGIDLRAKAVPSKTDSCSK